MDWITETFYQSGLDEALSGPCKDYHGAFREIHGDSSFNQPPFKIVEVLF
jgi:hypothetical protein